MPLSFNLNLRMLCQSAARRPLKWSSVVALGALTLSLALPSHADTIVRVSSFDYDAQGLLISETVEPDSPNDCLQTIYGYDTYGNKTSVTSQACAGASGSSISSAGTARTTTTAFEAQSVTIAGVTFAIPAGTFPTRLTNALGQQETREYDPRFGQTTKLTGPNGLSTTWEYDNFGRKVKETRADGTYTQWTYLLCTASGANCPQWMNVAWVTVEQSYGTNQVASAPEKRAFLDILGRGVRTQTTGFDGTSPGLTLVQDNQFDSRGPVWRQTDPYDLSTGWGPSWIMFQRDALGRVSYTASSNQADTGPASYNGLSSSVSRAGQTKTTTRNTQGKVSSVTDNQGNTVTYTYDALGQLLSTNAAGVVTSMTYNKRGQKITMVDPAMGSWQYQYNVFGELVWQKDSLGQVTTMSYDLLGRMVQRVEPDLSSDWSYDKKFDGTSCGTGVGKLCEAKANNGYRRTHAYDSVGRLSSTATVLDNAASPAVVSVTFDAVTGRLATKTWPTGYQASYTYTPLGYLKKVTGGGTTGFTQTVSYEVLAMNPRGQITQYRQGNQVTTVKSFDDGNGRLNTLQATLQGQSAGNVLNQSYGYDTLGNLSSRSDTTPGVGVQENFSYDDLNRLTMYLNTSGGSSRSVEVRYDARGNIQYKSDVGTYVYDSARPSRLMQVTLATPAGATITNSGTRTMTYAYDDSMTGAQTVGNVAMGNGNLMSMVSQDSPNGRNTMRWETYSSFNMPAQIMFGGFADLNNPVNTVADRTLSYVYGPEHQRIKERVQLSGHGTSAFTPGTTWYLNGEDSQSLTYEKEIKDSGYIEHRHYVSAGGVVFAMQVSRTGTLGSLPASSTRYYHHDQMGSIAAISDENGLVVERLAYDPWGKRRFVNGTTDVLDSIVGVNTQRGFTMHEHLDEVGVIHMNGRIYDPLIGRFMSADPFIQSPENLQSYNRYAYVLNNPLAMTDPSGYFSLGKLLRTVVAIYIAINAPEFFAQHGVVVEGMNATVAQVINAAAAGALAAGVQSGGNVQAMINGAFTASLFNWAGGIEGSVNHLLAHAAAGCVSAVAGNASCGPGAMSAVFGAYVTEKIGSPDGKSLDWKISRGVIATVAGGVASVIAGGKFDNGATTAAFGYLFNFLAHVWMPDLSRGQVGHVMITTDDGRVIESQFPSNHAPLGPNTTLTAAETVASEGRPADHVYYIPNDSIDLAKATAVGQNEANKPTWALLAVNGQTMTNCSVAAINVLSAVNQWVDGLTKWQVPSPWNFNSVLNVLSDWQKSGTANTNVFKIR